MTETTSPEQRIKSGANWFYWIAALSLINSVMVVLGKDGGFIVGLGITQVIDALAAGIGESGVKVVALVLDLGVISAVVATGYFARRYRAVYLVGMALYALDAGIYALASDWLAVGFHGFVLFTMIPGAKAFAQLREAAAAPPLPPVPEALPPVAS